MKKNFQKSKFFHSGSCPVSFAPDATGLICYKFINISIAAQQGDEMCRNYSANLPIFRNFTEFDNFRQLQ